MPHHSPAPRRVALALAFVMAVGRRVVRDASDRRRRGAGRRAEAADRAPREAVQRSGAPRAGSSRRPRRRAALRGAPRGTGAPRSSRSTARSTSDDGSRPCRPRRRRRVSVSVDFDSVQLLDVSRHFGRRRALAHVSLTARRRRHRRAARPERRRQVDADRHARDAGVAVERRGPLRRRDRAPGSARRLRTRIGLLAHELHLYPELSARQNLTFFARAVRPRSAARWSTRRSSAAGLADRGDDAVGGFLARHAAAARARARAAAPARGSCCSTSRSPASTIARSASIADRLRAARGGRRDRPARDARSRSGRRPGHARRADSRRPAARRRARRRRACAPATAR